jgi:hypothetical protein
MCPGAFQGPFPFTPSGLNASTLAGVIIHELSHRAVHTGDKDFSWSPAHPEDAPDDAYWFEVFETNDVETVTYRFIVDAIWP